MKALKLIGVVILLAYLGFLVLGVVMKDVRPDAKEAGMYDEMMREVCCKIGTLAPAYQTYERRIRSECKDASYHELVDSDYAQVLPGGGFYLVDDLFCQ